MTGSPSAPSPYDRSRTDTPDWNIIREGLAALMQHEANPSCVEFVRTPKALTLVAPNDFKLQVRYVEHQGEAAVNLQTWVDHPMLMGSGPFVDITYPVAEELETPRLPGLIREWLRCVRPGRPGLR